MALSLAACRQTIVLRSALDGGRRVGQTAGRRLSRGRRWISRPNHPRSSSRSIDRLGMGSASGDSTVLAAARDAIAPARERYQKLVRFGYVEFPGAGNVCSRQAGCCARPVSLPSGNLAAFDVALHACDQIRSPGCSIAGYQRPTTSALASCAAGLFLHRAPTASGATSCWSATAGRTAARTRIPDASMRRMPSTSSPTNNVSTIVVAPGQLDPDTVDCLEQIALYGGADDPPYLHPASTPRADDEIGDITRAMAHGRLPAGVDDADRGPGSCGVFWKDDADPASPYGRLGTGRERLRGRAARRVVRALDRRGTGGFRAVPNCDPQR